MTSTADLPADTLADEPVATAPAPAGDTPGKSARAGRVMALATFAMAIGSGLQALLYLRTFGVNARTDGFFAAFAIYAVFGVFCQSLRVTSAPLLVAGRDGLGLRRFAAAFAVIALPVIIVTWPLAGVVAHLLAPSGGHAGLAVMTEALPILGAAMVFTLWAAGAATVLAVADRFNPIAVAYASGAAAGLVGFLGLEHLTGERSLGFSMAIMAAVTLAMMLLPLRAHVAAIPRERLAAVLAPRPLLRSVGALLARTGIYLAFNGLYLVTLAFAGHYATGDTTVVSYAYLFVSYLVAGTGFALGMARVADMARGAAAGRDVLGTVPEGYRYVMLLTAPVLAGLIVCGAPVAGAVLPRSLTAHDVGLLQRCALLMAPWLIAAQLVNLLLPVAFARGATRRVTAAAPVLVVAQVACTALGALLFGLDGAVAAMWVAPLGLAVALGAGAARGQARRELLARVGTDSARFGGLAIVAFGAGWLAGRVVGGVGGGLIAGVLGATLYLAGLAVVARAELAALLRRGGAVDPIAVAPAAARRRRRPRVSADRVAVVALVLIGVAAMAHQWDGRILWETDGLFYQAKVLEIRGMSTAHALHTVFDGPVGAFSRHSLGQGPAAVARAQARPGWPAYSAQFYSRRLALPYLAALIYPLFGLRSLQLLSLLGYVLIGPLLYALLRQRFRPLPSLAAAVVCLALPTLRQWSIFPMGDSWGIALEIAALLCAVLAVRRGRRWLIPWVASVFLLSITRDAAFLGVIAAAGLWLATRSRMSIALTLTAILAAIPAPLLHPINERVQLAYVFADHTIPHDATWSFVFAHYLPNLGHVLNLNLAYAVHQPLVSSLFIVGAGLFALDFRRRDPWHVVVASMVLGYGLLLAVGPSFSQFRYELVLLPLLAAGLAAGAERVIAVARSRLATRSARGVLPLG